MDYNIYIHSGETHDIGEATTPWQSSENGGSSNFQSKVSNTIQEAQQTPNMIVGVFQSARNAIVSHPFVATALAVLTLTDKAVDVMSSFYTTETGQYAFRVGYDNFKNGIHAVLNPVGSTMNYLRIQQQYRLTNQKAEIQRTLFGDIAYNNGKFYGV